MGLYRTRIFLSGTALLKSAVLALDYLALKVYGDRGFLSIFWRWVCLMETRISVRIIPNIFSKIQSVAALILMIWIAIGQRRVSGGFRVKDLSSGIPNYRHDLSSVAFRFYSIVGPLSLYLAMFEASLGGFQVLKLYGLSYV